MELNNDVLKREEFFTENEVKIRTMAEKFYKSKLTIYEFTELLNKNKDESKKRHPLNVYAIIKYFERDRECESDILEFYFYNRKFVNELAKIDFDKLKSEDEVEKMYNENEYIRRVCDLYAQKLGISKKESVIRISGHLRMPKNEHDNLKKKNSIENLICGRISVAEYAYMMTKSNVSEFDMKRLKKEDRELYDNLKLVYYNMKYSNIDEIVIWMSKMLNKISKGHSNIANYYNRTNIKLSEMQEIMELNSSLSEQKNSKIKYLLEVEKDDKDSCFEEQFFSNKVDAMRKYKEAKKSEISEENIVILDLITKHKLPYNVYIFKSFSEKEKNFFKYFRNSVIEKESTEDEKQSILANLKEKNREKTEIINSELIV